MYLRPLPITALALGAALGFSGTALAQQGPAESPAPPPHAMPMPGPMQGPGAGMPGPGMGMGPAMNMAPGMRGPGMGTGPAMNMGPGMGEGPATGMGPAPMGHPSAMMGSPSGGPHRWMGREGGRRGAFMRHIKTWSLFGPHGDLALSPSDVQTIAEAILLRHGEHGWKVGDVTPNADNTVSFAFLTKHGDVVARFTMDTATGRITRTE